MSQFPVTPPLPQPASTEPSQSTYDQFAYQPSYLPTPAQRKAAEDADAAARADVGLSGWDAAASQTPFGYVFRQWDRFQASPDPNYQLTDEKLKQATVGIDPAHWGQFADASSDAELQMIREQLLGRQEASAKLASLGWTGTGLQLATGLLDPVTWAVGLATGGMGELVGLGGMAGRTGAIIRNGLVGGVTGGAIESYVASQDNTRGARDILYGIAVGGALGGGLGGLFHGAAAEQARIGKVQSRDLEAAFKGLYKQVELTDLTEANGGRLPDWTGKGEDYFREAIDLAKSEGHPQATLNAVSPAPDDPFVTAIGRLTGLDPSKKLNRSEVDAILEGTGYKTANQGFPTVEDMRGYLENMQAATAKPPAASPTTAAPGTTPKPPPAAEADWHAPRVNAPEASMGAATPGEVAQTIEPQKDWIDRTADDLRLDRVSYAKGTSVNVLGAHIPFVSDGIGMTDQLVQSDVPSLRVAGRVLGEETLPPENGTPVIESATRHTERASAVRLGKFLHEDLAPHFQDWGKRNGVNWWNRGRKLNEFAREVGLAVRAEPGKYTSDPAVNGAAAKARAAFAEHVDIGQRSQIPGYENIQKSPNYLPRVQNKSAIAKLTADLKPGEVQRLVEGALRDHNAANGKPLTDALRRILAKAWLAAGDHGGFTEVERANLLSPRNADRLREAIRVADPSITDERLNDIMHQVHPEDAQKNLAPAAHDRLDIMENYEATLDAKDGSRRTVKFSDLLENNIVNLYAKANRSLQGTADMQEVYRLFAANSSDTINSRATLLDRLYRDAIDQGMTPKDARAAVSKVDALSRNVLGIPQERGVGEGLATTMQIARKLNYMRVFGLAPFAHADNIGRIIGGNSAATTFRSIPNFLGVVKEIITSGKMRNELFNEWRRFGDLGTEMEHGSILDYMDREAWGNDSTGGNVKAWLDKGVKTFGKYTLLQPIMTAMQKMAVVAGEQKWADFAKSGKIPSAKRLALWGLTADDAAEIHAQFNQHATYGEGGYLVTAGLDKWDANARAKFVVAIDRWGRQAAQTSDIGNLPLWMTTETGKTLIQGRSFHMTAIDKQLRYNLYARDLQSFTTISTGMMLAGMAYVAREYSSSLGRPDQKEYLAQRLTVENISKAAFAKTGFFSMFPPVVDLASMNGQLYPKQFSFTRTSGLEADPIFGNPTLDFATKLVQVPGTLAHAATGRYSQKDAEIDRILIPYQNALGVKNVLDTLEKKLPRTSPN